MIQTQTEKKQRRPLMPRRKLEPGIDFHNFPLRVFMDNWNRMIQAGVSWGKATQFINDAIREKLDREAG